MVDMTLVTSVNAAIQLAKTLAGVRDASMIDAKVIELREHLIEAQSGVVQAQTDQSALIQEVRDLKEKIMKMENWKEEKHRYQLRQPWSGCFVYLLKESSKGAEPPHWICAKCYDDGRRTILQPQYDKVGFVILVCPTCKSEIHTRLRGIGSA